jgi:uncharacterized repeat protein (TIGR03803 family)
MRHFFDFLRDPDFKRFLLRQAINVGVGAVLVASCGPVHSNLPFQADTGHVTQTSRRTSQNYKLIYVFQGKPDGATPYGAMAYLNGSLYGTTTRGGKNDEGTVFKVDTAGNESVIHSFGGSGDGAAPYGGLIAVNGLLYGTTESGGAHGNGTVFHIAPSGHEEIDYSFDYNDGRTDGMEPDATLLRHDGILYGTTVYGGQYDYGTVFGVTLGGKESVLHAFGGGDGAYPVGSVALLHGVLYGTTDQGGGGRGCGQGCGTVFKIDRSGNETVIHSFGGINYADGQYPAGGLVAIHGLLYGTTTEGGRAPGVGTIFSVTPNGEETIVHQFAGSPDGAYPYDGVTAVNGSLCGTTELGGINGYGTAFCLTSLGLENRYSFGTQSPGIDPYAPLTKGGGFLYGTTSEGGDANAGTIFQVTL